MKIKNREALLKIGALTVIGLLAIDRFVLTPAGALWKAQGEQIDSLNEKLKRGRQLIGREATLRDRWANMQRTDLPEDSSAAEDAIFKAISRWTNTSKLNFTSLASQWRPHDDGYETFEWRATATGDQVSLGRLLYEIEADPLPARIEDCELSTRDNRGQQLTLSLRMTFLRLAKNGNNP